MGNGSSPRVWGQGILTNSGATVQGIIPTRMGTRVFVNICIKNTEDHPHAYGDKPSDSLAILKLEGSSPRVWGQETVSQIGKTQVRIIPTRMGTRWHGHLITFRDSGSSPRVWGQVP